MEYTKIKESDCRCLLANSIIYKSVDEEKAYNWQSGSSRVDFMEAYKVSSVNHLSKMVGLVISSIHWVCYPSPGDIMRLNISFSDMEKQNVWWFKTTDKLAEDT